VSGGGSLLQEGNPSNNTNYSGASAAWNGSVYGQAFVGGGSGRSYGQVRFTLPEVDGAPVLVLGEAVCMDGCQTVPNVAWSGSEFVVAWVDENSNLHRTLVSAAGDAILSDDVVVSSAVAGMLSAAWSPEHDELGVVYMRRQTAPEKSTSSYELIFARMKTSGDLYDGHVLSSDGGSRGSVRAHEGEYVIAFSGGDFSDGFKIRFARLGCPADLQP
jgi:hypothetical protein